MHDEMSARAEIVKADPMGLVGKDELGLGHLLGDYRVVAYDEDTNRRVMDWTKYQKADDQGCVVRLNADEDIVAVRVGVIVACVWRELEDRVDIGGGRTWMKYRIRAVRSMSGPKASESEADHAVEEAKAHLGEIREGVDLMVARDLEGFGDGAWVQAAMDDASANPMAPLLDDEDDVADPVSEIVALMGGEEVYE